MILVSYENIGQLELQQKYAERVNLIDEDYFDKSSKEWLIKYVESIKLSDTKYLVTFINYSLEIITCLNTLKIPYKVIYRNQDTSMMKITFDQMECEKIIIEQDIETSLKEFLQLEVKVDEVVKETTVKEYNEVETNKETEEKKEETENTEKQEMINAEEVPVVIDSKDKNKLTLQELLDEDVVITESDIRDLKATQNKLKAGMLLQAKSSLNRVTKLSSTLNKLYDELIDRIDDSIGSTDTASLMYTAEYLSKALSDTNQFIISLINNEKIQNFFVIDNNTTIINLDSTDRYGIDQREKIRKAAEIVMNNLDYFTSGEYKKIKDPNTVIETEAQIVEEKSDANTPT